MSFLWLLGGLLSILLAFGCSATNGANQFGGGGAASTGSSTGTHATSSSSGGGKAGSGSTTSGCMLGCNTGTTVSAGTGNPQGMLEITPPMAALTMTVGMATVPTAKFKVTLNNVDITNSVTWSYDRPDVGDILTGSTFTPTGIVGGTGQLTASYQKHPPAAATVTVSLTQTVNTGGLTPAQQTALKTPSNTPDPIQLVYPYDQTVFPLGVLPPDLQWNGATAGDLYELTLTETYYSYTEYFKADPPSDHLLADLDWKNFEDSGNGAKGDPVSVKLTHLSGATVYAPTKQTWHVAQGRLHGSVYYWELPDNGPGGCGNQNAGRVLRIKPDSTAVDQFYPNNGGCYGCHTVSRDGKTMMAAFSIGSPFPQLTIDLTQNPAVPGTITQATGLGGTFSAFNNLGDKILISNDAASNPSADVLRIVDAKTGSVLNPDAMGAGCGEPAWSPDGKTIASICNLAQGGWIFDATQGELAVGTVAANGTTVSNQKPIVMQGAVGTGRPAYPSFSPGSGWISFGNPSAGSRSTGNGKLWIVAPDGTNLSELSTASSDNKSFNGVFAPLRAGGYFWLVFITRRDYGNQIVGADRQQLWITAIDDPPKPNVDPSHPPFYMRGQENCGKSENAYYALDPCKMLGQSCVSGIDCCNGQCVKDPNTKMYVCGNPPPPGMCSQEGNSCKTKSDCCDTQDDCVDGFCQRPIPT